MPPSYPNILDKAMHGSLEVSSSTDQEFFLCHSDPRFKAEDLISCYLYLRRYPDPSSYPPVLTVSLKWTDSSSLKLADRNQGFLLFGHLPASFDAYLVQTQDWCLFCMIRSIWQINSPNLARFTQACFFDHCCWGHGINRIILLLSTIPRIPLIGPRVIQYFSWNATRPSEATNKRPFCLPSIAVWTRLFLKRRVF